MKINVSVDVADFMDYFNEEALDKLIAEELKMEILKVVKKDPKYKAYINKQATKMLDGLTI